jgi:nitrogen fixation protein FixH
MVMTDNVNSNRPQPDSVKLTEGDNTFDYQIVTKEGDDVSDANVTFLLTRPHTRTEDMTLNNLPYMDGLYRAKMVTITKPGRYTLQLKVQVGDAIGYSEIPAYLKPQIQ